VLRAVLLIAGKDLRLIGLRGAGVAQALLLGLLLILVFSLSRQTGENVSARTAAAIFWLASAFCLVLAGSMVHGIEEHGGIRTALRLAPIPASALWLGKALTVLCVLLLAQAMFLPSVIAFLGQRPGNAGWWAAGGLLLVDVGLAEAGSLLGALAQGRAARESLLCVLLFPLIVPLLLAGIQGAALFFGPASAPVGPADGWALLAAAFDAVFCAIGLVLSPFAYAGGE
jgi:heme exporter protein B